MEKRLADERGTLKTPRQSTKYCLISHTPFPLHSAASTCAIRPFSHFEGIFRLIFRVADSYWCLIATGPVPTEGSVERQRKREGQGTATLVQVGASSLYPAL